MKTIPIISKHFSGETLVDDQDYEYLTSFGNWHIQSSGYAMCKKKFLHHCILPKVYGLNIDHINGNKLDNRRSNLRYATTSQNQINRGPGKNNRSGAKGIYKHHSGWRAEIKVNGNKHRVFCKSKRQAIEAYDLMAIKFYGEYAKVNRIQLRLF